VDRIVELAQGLHLAAQGDPASSPRVDTSTVAMGVASGVPCARAGITPQLIKVPPAEAPARQRMMPRRRFALTGTSFVPCIRCQSNGALLRVNGPPQCDEVAPRRAVILRVR
jgi:hypothetical protein